jgi:hypothetical protein
VYGALYRVLVAYQVTSQTNAQNILHLKKCTHGQRLIASVGNFQMYRGGSEGLEKHKKCVREKTLLLQIKQNTLEILSVPMEKI